MTRKPASRPPGAPPACDACGGNRVAGVLDLGHMPASDGFLSREQLAEPERLAPLRVARCDDCGLLMLQERLPPAELFGADYLYCSAVSSSLREHFSALASDLLAEGTLTPGASAIEVACNDGFLLAALKARSIEVLGIEPAPHPAARARERGLPVLQRFLDLALARELRDQGQRPQLVIANNVLAHNPALDDFAAALATLTGEGLLLLEVPYLGDLLATLAFDTIYHEHVFYFSLTALARLFGRHGLALERVARLPVQAGSLRLYLRRDAVADPSVEALLAEEAEGSLSRGRVEGFATAVRALKHRGREMIGDLKAKGHRIAAYGAAAKGTILLNQLGLDGSLLDYVVDRNPLKQGRWVPGVRLPVVGPERLLSDPVDHLLILPWNLAPEIRAQQAAWERRGGRFILPLPDFEILE